MEDVTDGADVEHEADGADMEHETDEADMEREADDADPEIVLVRNRIADGKTGRLREWMAEIREREAEALATLEHEGMHAETAFLEEREEADYLLYYMVADDIDRVFEAFAESPHEIDHEHAAVLDEVLADDQPAQDVELLYHLENPER